MDVPHCGNIYTVVVFANVGLGGTVAGSSGGGSIGLLSSSEARRLCLGVPSVGASGVGV